MKTTWVQRNISPIFTWAFAKAGFVDRRILADRVRILASQLDEKGKQQLWYALAAQPYEVRLRNLLTPKKLVHDEGLVQPLEEMQHYHLSKMSTIKRLALTEERFRLYTGRDDFRQHVVAPVLDETLAKEEGGDIDRVFQGSAELSRIFESQKPLILLDLSVNEEGESLQSSKVLDQVFKFAKQFSGLNDEKITYRIQKMADIGGDMKTIIAALFMHMDPLVVNAAFMRIQGQAEFSELEGDRENVCGLIAIARQLFECFKFDANQLFADNKQIFRKMCELMRKTSMPQALVLFFMMKLFYAREVTPERDGIFNEIRFILAPLAERLGLIYLADDFRDQYLRLTDPEKHREIVAMVKKKLGMDYEAAKIFLEMYSKEVLKYLRDRGVDVANIDIKYRVKSPYSLFEKIFCRNQGHSFEEIKDILGLKVICRSKKEAQLISDVLRKGEVFAAYKGSIKNALEAQGEDVWLGIKLVGETIATSPSQPIEIQIMTKEMNQANNHGKAAHWWYKLLNELAAFASESGKEKFEQVMDKQEKRRDMTETPFLDFYEILNFATIDPRSIRP